MSEAVLPGLSMSEEDQNRYRSLIRGSIDASSIQGARDARAFLIYWRAWWKQATDSQRDNAHFMPLVIAMAMVVPLDDPE